MPLMVRGDLSVFPILSVMQMLLTSGRAGRLSADHPRGGQLWIERGEIIHAVSGKLRGEAALQLFSSLDGGTFTFEPDLRPAERTLSLRRDNALHRMIEESDAWAALLRDFPDWNKKLRFSSKWNEAQPVTRGQYHALNLVERNLSIQHLIEFSDSPRDTLETLRPFLMAGLIEQY